MKPVHKDTINQFAKRIFQSLDIKTLERLEPDNALDIQETLLKVYRDTFETKSTPWNVAHNELRTFQKINKLVVSPRIEAYP